MAGQSIVATHLALPYRIHFLAEPAVSATNLQRTIGDLNASTPGPVKRSPALTLTVTQMHLDRRLALLTLALAACSPRADSTRDSGATASSSRDSASTVTSTPPDTAAPKPSSTDSTGAWRMTVSGGGPLRVGMTFAEAATALHVALPDTSKIDRACAYVKLDSLPDGILLMWVEGRLARLDVTKPSITTELGARVGDSETQIRKVYEGSFNEKPHKYVSDGKYIVVAAPMAGDGSLRLVFETDGTKVTRYRVGREPEVEWIEGCS